MGLRTTGKNIIDRQISEALLIDQERSEWPIERFQSLVKTLKEKKKPISAEIPISIIKTDHNIRRLTDTSDIDKLAKDIEENGLIHSPTVTVTLSKSKKLHFTMVAGHRRILALKKLGKRTSPVTIQLFNDEKERLQASFSENIQRKNMDPFDLAKSFQMLKASGLSSEYIGEKWGFDVSTISRYIRFNKWGDELVKFIKEHIDQIPVRVLFELLPESRYDDSTRMNRIKDTLFPKQGDKTKSEAKQAPKRSSAQSRINEIVQSNKYSEDQLQLISDFLLDAKIIKAPISITSDQ